MTKYTFTHVCQLIADGYSTEELAEMSGWKPESIISIIKTGTWKEEVDWEEEEQEPLEDIVGYYLDEEYADGYYQMEREKGDPEELNFND